MMNRYLLTAGLLAIVMFGIKISAELSKTPTYEENELADNAAEREFRTNKSKKFSTPSRFPASAAKGNPTNNGPSFRESDKNDNLFQNTTGDKLGSEPSGPPAGGGFAGYNSFPEISPQNDRGNNHSSPTSIKNEETQITAVPHTIGSALLTPPPQVTLTPPPASDGSSSSDTLTCSANLGTGAYSSTQSVALTCTANAEIKYCLSENICCDPDSGNIYSGPINIGVTPGNFCLSFQGTKTNSSKTSGINEISYAFNASLPDLQVAHPKIVYQTTELNGQLNITSNDFGKDLHSLGVINLKNHDPGTSGLNWSCANIIDEHTTLTAAAPTIPMAATDVATVPNSSQIDEFLNNLNLGYGKNYVTSYIINNNFMDTYVSCSSTLVTLEDFEYFEAGPNQAEVGTNDVREFSGGFTHLGFFEEESVVYRGPAGLGSQNVAAQELKSGLFGVFY